MSAACAPDRTALYRRRQPERTALYRTVQTHLATWLERSCDSRQGSSAPGYVEREFRRYLECGILAWAAKAGGQTSVFRAVFGAGLSVH